MKLPAGQIAGFLERPDPARRVFLFFGPDGGLARERAHGLIRKLVKDPSDPFAVVAFQGSELGANSAKLYDEAAAIPFGGGRKLIRLQQAAETNSGPLADFLKNPPQADSVIVIEAGDLDSRSKLRTLCEKDASLAVAVPCYVEDAAQRQNTVAAHLKKEGLTASRDVLRFLADILPPDRLALRSEMDKLTLYARGQKEVTMEDARAVIADASGSEMDDLIAAACGGDCAKTMQLLDHFFAEQVSCVTILRAFQRHLMRLAQAQAWRAQGLSADEALKKLAPPVFWKAQEPMKRQLARLSAAQIEKRLNDLLQTEAATKRTGAPDQTLTAHLLLSFSGTPPR